jgi:signal transduction histidine kinase
VQPVLSRNDRELFTQEEAVIAEIKALRDQWEQQRDPLVRYEQGERQTVRDHLAALLTELERWEGLGRSAKKPLYVRKLERELRENLERAAESERAFNVRQQERYLLARSRLLRVVGRLRGASGRMGRESLVNEAKNDLLRNYIDRFNDCKMSERELEGYRQEYQRTLQGIAQTLRQELHSYSLLLQFAGKLEASATTAYRGILDAEDQFSAEMRGVSEEIFTIVNPRDVIEVVHNCKHFFAFTREYPHRH